MLATLYVNTPRQRCKLRANRIYQSSKTAKSGRWTSERRGRGAQLQSTRLCWLLFNSWQTHTQMYKNVYVKIERCMSSVECMSGRGMVNHINTHTIMCIRINVRCYIVLECIYIYICVYVRLWVCVYWRMHCMYSLLFYFIEIPYI